MLERIADEVFVQVRQDATILPNKRRVAALQYVVQNRGMQRVSVRFDFSASQQIQLVSPSENDREEEVTDRGDSASGAQPMVVDVVASPLQRRHVVHVVRCGGERAFVRVDYRVTEAVAVEVGDELRRLAGDREALLLKLTQQSNAAYGAIVSPTSLPASQSWVSQEALHQWAADLSRWSERRGIQFVDPSFPPSRSSLWGGEDSTIASSSQALERQCMSWGQLNDIVDSSWSFVQPSLAAKSTAKVALTKWNTRGLAGQESWVCAMQALHECAPAWCERWFGQRQCNQWNKSCSRARNAVIATLCPQGKQWVSFAIDMFVPVVVTDGTKSGDGLSVAWPHSGDAYALVLQKAYAKLCGSYASIARRSTRTILEDMTGLPLVQVPAMDGVDAQRGMLDALLGAVEPRHKDRETRPRNLVVVSFGAVDDHHCAFQVVGASTQSRQSGATQLVFRDPSGALRQSLSSLALISLNDANDTHDDAEFCLSDQTFLHLSPRVFELLEDHAYSWRRRKIVSTHLQTKSSFQLALSCASLQDIVLSGYVTSASRQDSPAEDVPLAVHRVEQDWTWSKLDLSGNAESDTRGSTVNCDSSSTHLRRVRWAAAPGEYIVTLDVEAPSASEDVQTIDQRLSRRDVQSNLERLFQCLDQDMDGRIGKDELITFLQSHEELLQHEASSSLSAIVDTFLDKYTLSDDPTIPSDSRALTVDDLRDVFESLAAVESTKSRNGSETLDEDLAILVWRDLHQTLGQTRLCTYEAIDSSAIPLNAIVELHVAVFSERDDVRLAVLS